MNNYKKLARVTKYFAIALSASLAKLFSTKFESKIDDDSLLFIISIAIIAIGIEYLPGVFEFLLEIPFLKRAIIREHYLDGTWLELDSKNGEPIEVGITRIKIKNEKIIYGGTTFPIAPYSAGSGSAYTATIIDLNWPTLKYIYEFKRFDSESSKLHGYGELDFDTRDGYPITCRGHYISLESGEKVSLEKWKVTDKVLLKKLDSPKDYIPEILSFFAEIGRIKLKKQNNLD
jgi:hypothetical protein